LAFCQSSGTPYKKPPATYILRQEGFSKPANAVGQGFCSCRKPPNHAIFAQLSKNANAFLRVCKLRMLPSSDVALLGRYRPRFINTHNHPINSCAHAPLLYPTAIVVNESLIILPRCPSEFINDSMTCSGVFWPSATFSPTEV